MSDLLGVDAFGDMSELGDLGFEPGVFAEPPELLAPLEESDFFPLLEESQDGEEAQVRAAAGTSIDALQGGGGGNGHLVVKAEDGDVVCASAEQGALLKSLQMDVLIDAAPTSPVSPAEGAVSSSGGGGVRSLSSNVSAITDALPQLGAVARAKKAAEDFAARKVAERRRKAGRGGAEEERDGPAKKRRKTAAADGGDDGEEDDEESADNAEKVSHRKYQKRLQKNRDSAFVSRIRRREYIRQLEETLESTEQEKEDAMSGARELRRKYDIVCAELAAMKEATSRRFAQLGSALVKPVGASAAAAHSVSAKATNAVVTTMFMFAIMFGVMLPHRASSSSTSSRAPVGAHPGVQSELGALPSALGASAEHGLDAHLKARHGRVWNAGAASRFSEHAGVFPELESAFGPVHPALEKNMLINELSLNATEILGEERARKIVQLVQSRVENGSLSASDLAEVTGNAETVVRTINARAGRGVRRDALEGTSAFQRMLNGLSNAADDRFKAELIALLTVQLIPTDSKRTMSQFST